MRVDEAVLAKVGKIIAPGSVAVLLFVEFSFFYDFFDPFRLLWPRANRFEGIVPMMVFSNDAEILKQFEAVQATNHDRTSHFQIFSTLGGNSRLKVKLKF